MARSSTHILENLTDTNKYKDVVQHSLVKGKAVLVRDNVAIYRISQDEKGGLQFPILMQTVYQFDTIARDPIVTLFGRFPCSTDALRTAIALTYGPERKIEEVD